MERLPHHLRALVTLGPAERDHWAALRVGLSVAIPVLVLLGAGRPDLTIYAVFGAFTGMYGRHETPSARVRHQSRAAAMLVAGVGIGVVLSVNEVHSWGLAAATSCFAAAGSLFADRAGLRPVGPFFGMFALGACASVPTDVPIWVALGICLGAAALSLGIGAAGGLRRRGDTRESAPAGLVMAPRVGPAGRDPRQMWLRAASYVVAVGAAGTLTTMVGLGHPFWAMAAAAVPLAAVGLSNRIGRGLHRILGTLVGIGVTAIILLPFGSPEPTVLALLVIALQFPTELFMTRNYGLALVFFTPLILLMTQLAYPVDPQLLLVDRAIQTALGASVGIAVALLVHPRRRASVR